MKITFRLKLLPLFPLLCGCAALVLQLRLLESADEKGLLQTDHPAKLLLVALSAAVMVILLLHVRTLPAKSRYSHLFPPSTVSALGCLAGSAGILYAAITAFSKTSAPLSWLILLSGILAALALLYTVWHRLTGMRPRFPLHSFVAVFFMFSAIIQARQWSSQTQLHLYLAPLMAAIFLMLTAYHHAQLELQKGHLRLIFFSQAALYFCILSCFTENRIFYICMAIWLAAGASTFPGKKKHSPKYLKEA